MPTRAYLNYSEAARYLGISRPTLYRLVAKGEIASVLLPGVRAPRIERSELHAYEDRILAVPITDDGLPARSRARRERAS